MCNNDGTGTPALMLCVGLAGKGDNVMQNPGGQTDRPVSFHFLERSVYIVCTVFFFYLSYNVKGIDGAKVEMTVV